MPVQETSKNGVVTGSKFITSTGGSTSTPMVRLAASTKLTHRLPQAPTKQPTKQLTQIGHIAQRLSIPCIHLGPLTGQKKDCTTCGGAKEIAIHTCEVFKECTVERQLITQEHNKRTTYQWCVTCPKYSPKSDTQLDDKPVTSVTPTTNPSNLPMPPLSWSYGVTTVWIDRFNREQRNRYSDLLPRTLESLKSAGFDSPILFVDGCPPKKALEYESHFKLHVETHSKNIGTHGNWYLTLHELYLRNPTAQRYAIFQDDLVTYKNLRQYLNWAPYPQRGYLNLYTFPHNQMVCPKNKNTGERYIGWYTANQRGLGAVALVFNNESARALLSTYHMVDRVQGPNGMRAVDGGIVESLRSGPIKYPEYTHNPSLVQHTGIYSSMNNAPHSMSECFNGEEFDAMSIVGAYNSPHVPVPSKNIQLG